jgi:hypothetical protein
MAKYLLAVIAIVGIASGAYLMTAKADKGELKAPEPLTVIG